MFNFSIDAVAQTESVYINYRAVRGQKLTPKAQNISMSNKIGNGWRQLTCCL